jgi:hypothetical protein
MVALQQVFIFLPLMTLGRCGRESETYGLKARSRIPAP